MCVCFFISLHFGYTKGLQYWVPCMHAHTHTCTHLHFLSLSHNTHREIFFSSFIQSSDQILKTYSVFFFLKFYSVTTVSKMDEDKTYSVYHTNSPCIKNSGTIFDKVSTTSRVSETNHQFTFKLQMTFPTL